jgi:beta-glucanase (GH16 family)
MKFKNYIFISFLFLTNNIFGQTPANDPHWQLLWEDNFTYFDSNKWVKAENCDHGGEPQIYTANNVDIWQGKLRIRLLEQTVNCCTAPPTTWICGGCHSKTHYYTSGWINTKDNYNMLYGYAEARIFFEYGNGLWPAFWLWSSESRYEEIDIVELFPGVLETGNNIYYGQRHDENMNTSHLHYDINTVRVSKNYIYPINNYNNWHTYAIEWSPNKIIIYVDGVVVNNIPNPNISDPKSIILNMALVDPNKNDIVLPYATGTMYIDYIKTYELENDCSTPIWTCNYNFSSHDNKVKSVISIGGSGCSNALSPNENIVLRAKNYVQINGDFTVPIGAELYIDCNDPCY